MEENGRCCFVVIALAVKVDSTLDDATGAEENSRRAYLVNVLQKSHADSYSENSKIGDSYSLRYIHLCS